MVESMATLGAQPQREQVVNGLLHAIRGIARHHSKIVISALLSEKVPHTKYVRVLYETNNFFQGGHKIIPSDFNRQKFNYPSLRPTYRCD